MSLLTTKSITFLYATSNFLKHGGYPVRHRVVNFEQLGIKWNRPEPVSSISVKKSGDGGVDLNIKPTDILKIYKDLPEFENLNEKMKPLFSVAYLSQPELMRYKLDMMKDLVRKHTCDKNSYEVQIAAMTNAILHFQELLKVHPRHRIAKRFLKELIEKRQKYLARLRIWDYKRFEWLLEKLNLVYYPPPTDRTPPHRKISIRRMVQTKYDKIVQEKIDAYKKQLQKEKEQFYKTKAEKLAFIRKEEIACGVEPTVTEEEIEEAQNLAKQYFSTSV